MSMSVSRIARAVAAKDLRIELRSRVVSNQVLPFSGLVMIMFAFALDNDDVLQRVAGGLVWLATLFSLFILVQRTFAVETYDGALDSLRVAGVNPQGIFIGKSVALFVQLLVLESVLFVAAVVLYRVNVNGSGVVLLVTCVLCATAGLAFVGTLYGGLTAGARGRETLLPLLLLPVVAPVLICATRATESAFRSGGVTVGEGWPWVGVLAVFAAVFGLGGLLSFGSLIEE
ncbi:MAG: heme exporter protein CcmB [Actinomycetota bacterium]|jgi:heme exporter protein B